MAEVDDELKSSLGRRCRSWRATPVVGHYHVPGTCRKCWRPCRNEPLVGYDRCRECYEQIVLHPNARIRQIAVDERKHPEWVLQEFARDPDIYVSQRADMLLARDFPAPAKTVPA